MEIYLFRLARAPAAPSGPPPCGRFATPTVPAALSSRVFLPLVLMLAPLWLLPGAMFSSGDYKDQGLAALGEAPVRMRWTPDCRSRANRRPPAAKGSYLGYLAVPKAKTSNSTQALGTSPSGRTATAEHDAEWLSVCPSAYPVAAVYAARRVPRVL